MKLIKTIPFGRAHEFVVPHPDRTMKKSQAGWAGQEQFFQFSNRQSMVKFIRKEQNNIPMGNPSRAVVPLDINEY